MIRTDGLDCELTGDYLHNRLGFTYQHACNQSKLPTTPPAPDPKGLLIIKKIVVYGDGASPFGNNFPPTSTPTTTPTPSGRTMEILFHISMNLTLIIPHIGI